MAFAFVSAAVSSKSLAKLESTPSLSHIVDDVSDNKRPPRMDTQEPQPAFTSISQFHHKIELYAGSVATVYQAVEVATGNRVVIKVYHKDKMQPKHLHKLEREIQSMILMNGSFVAELYGTFSDSSNIYLVMEYCEGGDLFKMMLKHGGRLEEHYVCVEIITPLLRVLEKMHSLQTMHRDIKPENIFLTKRGRLRLGDFGLAINWSQELPFSRSGTLDYMAPEVLQNPASQLQESPSVDLATLEGKKIKPFSCAVDVWAVGILAYELVCGRPPFEVEDEAKTVTRILYNNNIRFPSCYSAQWCDFIRYALIKDPAQRPNAKTLLTHPWVQSNLQRAISCAPTPLHRQAKEDLLRPLSLMRRSIRAPGPRPSAMPQQLQVPAQVQPGTPPSAPKAPSTPQPMKARPVEGVTPQLQHLHAHFSSMSCKEDRREAWLASTQDRSVQPNSPPPQQLKAAGPYTLPYKASPLSRNGMAAPQTPTRSNLGGQHQFFMPDFEKQQLSTQHSLPAAGSPSVSLDSLTQQRLAVLSEPGSKEVLGTQDMQLLMQSMNAQGVVQIVRNTPKEVTPQKPTSLAHSLLKSLFIPPGPQECPDDVVHPSPGPAGPGIKERLKWHLRSQAGDSRIDVLL